MMTHFSTRWLINRLVFVIFGTAVLALTACQSNAPATPTPLAAATSQPSHTPTPTVVVTETPALSNVELDVPTSTLSPTATQTNVPAPTPFPSLTPIPALVWAEDVNFAAQISGFRSSAVEWSPARNEFVATTCWPGMEGKILRFAGPTFDETDITPQEFSCELPDDIAWTPDGEKILHSDTFPEDHPNHPNSYNYDNSASWIMTRDGRAYQPVNSDEAYGRYLFFSDWLDANTMVYKYYCGGGYDCVVTLNIETGQRISTTVVHIGDGFRAGKDYVASNNGMSFDFSTTAVSIMDEIIHEDPLWSETESMLCLSAKCGALPCILSPCIDENSRFEDWLPGTNQMLVVTWPGEEYLFLTENYEDRVNPTVETKLQLWDVDKQMLTPLVDEAIFGRFSPDSRFLAYQTHVPFPQIHIMDFKSRQVLHTFLNAEPILTFSIAATKAPYLWSPDSTKLVFRNPQGNLTILNVSDGSQTLLSLFGGERLQNPQWSHDGRFLSVSVQSDMGGETAVLAIP
ncbi:MAG: hypothetical protein R3D55_22815 [Chloroflexota bacterium]